jgi:cell division protein FtsW
MSVNMGLLPTKGLTLPFMSYGGSSLITVCVMLALLLRVDHENRLLQANHPNQSRTSTAREAFAMPGFLAGLRQRMVRLRRRA